MHELNPGYVSWFLEKKKPVSDMFIENNTCKDSECECKNVLFQMNWNYIAPM